MILAHHARLKHRSHPSQSQTGKHVPNIHGSQYLRRRPRRSCSRRPVFYARPNWPAGTTNGESTACQRWLTSALAPGAARVAGADDGAGGGVTVQSGWPGIGGVFEP